MAFKYPNLILVREIDIKKLLPELSRYLTAFESQELSVESAVDGYRKTERNGRRSYIL